MVGRARAFEVATMSGNAEEFFDESAHSVPFLEGVCGEDSLGERIVKHDPTFPFRP